MNGATPSGARPSIWAILFRRKFIEDNRIRFKRFLDYDDDNVFIFDALCVTDSVCLLSEVGYTYLVRNDSYSRVLKYQSDYFAKIKAFNEYYLTNSRKAGLDAAQFDKYSRYREQATIRKLLLNYAVNPTEREWREIKEYYYQIKDNIKKEMLFEPTRFNRFIYFCLKNGFLKPVVMARRHFLKKEYGSKWKFVVR